MNQHTKIEREQAAAIDDAEAARDRRDQGLHNIQRVLDLIHGLPTARRQREAARSSRSRHASGCARVCSDEQQGTGIRRV
jgi:hypothetical protein